MKQAKFNLNSWHYKFYKFVTGSYRKPQNLCPYFWKLVLIISASWFLLPVYIVQIFNKDWKGDDTFDDGIGEKFLVSLLLWMVTVLFFLPSVALLEGLGVPIWIFILTAFLFWTAVACSLFILYNIIVGVDKLIKKFRKVERISNTTGLIESRFDAWYHNHCPKIEWVDDDDKF